MAFEHLKINEFKRMLEERDLVIVDIRDPISFESGTIESAKHLSNDNLMEFIAETDKNMPIVVCCYHGNSSQGAADFLNQQGFKQTYSLDGGYELWKISH